MIFRCNGRSSKGSTRTQRIISIKVIIVMHTKRRRVCEERVRQRFSKSWDVGPKTFIGAV